MSRPRKTRHGLPSRVYQKHGAFYFVDKANRWHRLGKGYAEAMLAYAKLLESDTSTTTMGQLFDRYQLEIIPTKAPATQKGNIKELAGLRHAFAHMRPEQIKAKHIYAYLDARKAPVRANREISLLSAVLKKAIRWGANITVNPCKDIEKNKETPRERYIEDDEFWAVHDMAPPAIQLAMLLSYLTGLRQGDVLGLQQKHLTKEGISIQTGKTGKKMLFKWTPALRAVVDQARALRGDIISMHLICRRDGQRYTGEGFRTMWHPVMQKYVAAGGQHFTFHGPQDLHGLVRPGD